MRDGDSTMRRVTVLGMIVGVALAAVMFVSALRHSGGERQCNNGYGICEVGR